MSTGLTIGEAADRLEVTAGYLRLGERIGTIPPVRRAPNGYRVYSDQDIEKLIRLGVGRRKKRLAAGS
jgi:DNA-binding transcriptional MerR regulator